VQEGFIVWCEVKPTTMGFEVCGPLLGRQAVLSGGKMAGRAFCRHISSLRRGARCSRGRLGAADGDGGQNHGCDGESHHRTMPKIDRILHGRQDVSSAQLRLGRKRPVARPAGHAEARAKVADEVRPFNELAIKARQTANRFTDDPFPDLGSKMREPGAMRVHLAGLWDRRPLAAEAQVAFL
jgi:hypothetical protein